MEVLGRLEERASASGAAGFGVCEARPFLEVRRELERRVAGGLSASMAFTFSDPARSTDVRASFPWAERLVVVAWAYLPEAGSPGPAVPGTGRIARFATEDHYEGLRRLLRRLAADLQAEGWAADVLADDNRLVDRAAAARAGVAWWGKNAMALTPGAGPWLLLGSVVTDAPLPTSAPMLRDCGTCSVCLPACPTGALVAPGVLDARLCLAHWAQAPGVIPRELRVAMGDRVYGCDDCLDACPPGRRLLASSRAPRGRVDLAGLLAGDDRTLLRRYAHFYVPRRRARYLRRNALVALGNAGGSEAMAICAGYAAHPDALLRAHAVWAVGRLGGRRAAAVLRTVADRERDPGVLDEIAHAQSAAGEAPGC